MEFKSFMEALKGKQHKIDKNKNGKIDAHDFKLLQKEEQESDDEIEFKTGDDQEDKEKEKKIEEKAPPGFEGTVKAMKKHKEIDNPYALAWYMKNKGMKSHKKASGAMKEEAEQIEERNKQNALMRKTMDASRGARYKLNNPVPPAEPEHKTARDHNVAIGRALRNEEKKDDVPFEGPYTKVKGDVKDKSGATHTPMSRAKHLAKMAMKKQMKEDIDRLFEKDDSEYNYEGEMAVTQLKTISRHAEALQAKMKPDTNLPEWVQSKITLATDYMQTAHDYLMSELDEQAPVAPVPGMKFKNHAVMVHPETKSRVVINRKNIDNYTSDGYKEVSPGQKLKEDEEVKFSYTELMMINEIKLSDLPVRKIKGHSYGADYSDPEGADDYDDKKPMKPTAEKRGRGRPAGSQSGARKNFGSSKLHTK